MALIQCPECGRDYSEHAKNCPNCGYSSSNKIAKETVKKTGNIIRSIIVVVVSLIISVLVPFFISEVISFRNPLAYRILFIAILSICISVSKFKGWIGNRDEDEDE